VTRSTKADVRRALVATFIARTAANGGLRVVYPFLPAIARGLEVSTAAVGTLVAIRNLGGLTTPLVARASERHGRRSTMVAAVAAVAGGCALSAAGASLVVVGAGIVVVGVAKPAFDIAMQAWFGDRVPYAERGRVFGITELTWAVALLVTVPISGVLIEWTNWRAPFVLVGVLALIGTVAVARGIAPDAPVERSARKLVLTSERTHALGVALLFSVAAEMPFVVYGQWLEGSFGLSVAGIGGFTLIVVVAEVVGEGLVAAYADRWGLRRTLLAGLLTSGAAYLALSLTGSALVVAAAAVAVWIGAFEVTIVAAIPFVSELAVDARDRLLSLLAVTIAMGRAIGALGGQALYASGGIRGVGVVSTGCVGLASLLLLRVSDPARHLPLGSTPRID
jgi:predicted MFS family arabinose efflux permease